MSNDAPGKITQATAVHVRGELHRVTGLLRQNLLIPAYELACALSRKMDAEYYKDETHE